MRMRERFNGILWRFRTGSGWRDVPERYESWSTLYDRFNAWSKAGVFQGLMDTLIAEAASRGQVGLELVSVDSTIVRAHVSRSGDRRGDVGRGTAGAGASARHRGPPSRTGLADRARPVRSGLDVRPHRRRAFRAARTPSPTSSGRRVGSGRPWA
ncbi:transposase [Streptomyces sp. NPDC058466]|uniref:transposase n=1 Tax=Streptomyces sp. NPDC058466 TaxID=3346512 RepID=UPI00365AA143